jgi:hypothetical protein
MRANGEKATQLCTLTWQRTWPARPSTNSNSTPSENIIAGKNQYPSCPQAGTRRGRQCGGRGRKYMLATLSIHVLQPMDEKIPDVFFHLL